MIKEVWSRNYDFLYVLCVNGEDVENIEKAGYIVTDVDDECPARCPYCGELAFMELVEVLTPEDTGGTGYYVHVVWDDDLCDHFNGVDEDGEYNFGLSLANCTMHSQDGYADDFKGIGVEIVTPPLGFEVKETNSAFDIKDKCTEIIDTICDYNPSGILVGGLSSQAYYFIKAAFSLGYRVFEVVTERVRDKNDRFTFNFKGLREIEDLIC